MSSRCTNSRSVHRRTCRHEANNATQERSPSGCAPRMGRRPRAVCFMSGSTLLRLKPEPAARLTSIIGRMMRAHRARIAQDTWRRGMLHGFAQYHVPRLLTMRVDGEFWGGKGGVRKCADWHCDHAGPAFDDVCDRRAAIRAELVSRLVPAVSHTLPRF